MTVNPCPTCGYQIDRVERLVTENARLRAMLDRIGRHPHATGEIRRYAGDALKRVYNADGEIACADTP